MDTFEEEEKVDIKAVAQEIKNIDTEMAEVDKAISDFCKELGIDAPF